LPGGCDAPTFVHVPAITRRHFGVLAASGLASTLLSPPPADAAPEPFGVTKPLRYGGGAAVSIAAVPRGAGADATVAAVRRAALAATDFSWLSRGDVVLVKPVCNSGNSYPATTDPLALYAMITLLRERGAGRVIVADMSGVQFLRFGPDHLKGSTRELMTRNGLAQAAADAGAELLPFEEAGWDAFHEETSVAASSWAAPVLMPALLEEVDHVVLMPRCARHLLAGSTLGLKAAVGWWRHDSRLEYHRDAATFSAKTAEANWVPSLRDKQRLVLTSATQVLTSFGPDDGFVFTPETGLVIAGTSVVAHDMVSLAWLLEGRLGMPEDKRDGLIDDPNGSQTFVNLSNRVVTYLLGGVRQAARMQSLPRYDLEGVFDDRVLHRAFELAGGIPRLELIDAKDGEVPAEVRRRLVAATRRPA